MDTYKNEMLTVSNNKVNFTVIVVGNQTSK